MSAKVTHPSCQPGCLCQPAAAQHPRQVALVVGARVEVGGRIGTVGGVLRGARDRLSVQRLTAQRLLAESIARELGPRGIHVAYVLIDAAIETPAMRKRFPEASSEFFIKPSAIADELWHLNRQDRSAWSFLTELRPFEEKW